MIIGHWSCAVIAHQTAFKREHFAVLVAASFFPDIVDKTANAVLAAPGRGIGHSLLFFVGTMALARAIMPEIGMHRGTLFPVAVLWTTHLIGDLVAPKVLFWPFLGPLDPVERFGFLMSAYNLYVARIWPGMLALDLLCTSVAVALWVW